jgi:hypothetical protein
MTKTQPEPETIDAASVPERTFVLNLTIGAIRTSAKVKRDKVETMAKALRDETRDPETVEEMAQDASDDADEIRVSKELLNVEEVRDLISELNSTRELIRSNAQPTKVKTKKSSTTKGKLRARSFLKAGLYLYAATRVDWVEAQLASAQERIDALLDKLEPRWEAIIEEDRKRLAPLGLFDPRDYPTLASIREATRLRYSWFRFEVPTALAGINKAVFEAEREKAKGMWAEVFDTIRLGYATTLEDAVVKLKASLVPGENGKTKVLRQASLDKFTEWLSLFRVQDVTGFEELAVLVDKAKAAMRGVDAEVLRTEDRVSERVAATMDEVGKALAPLVLDQQRRVNLRD